MNEFVEKLIDRLEESRKTALNKVKLPIMIVCKHDLQEFVDICFEESKNIVNQLAEEYKDGWIPCSEQLPPKPENNMLFENKPLEVYLATVRGSDYAWRVFWNGEYFTDGWNKVDVIAWQELPKVYKSKEGEL